MVDPDAFVPLDFCGPNEGCVRRDSATGLILECLDFVCVSDPDRTQQVGQECVTAPVDNCEPGTRCVAGKCAPTSERFLGESCVLTSGDFCEEGSFCRQDEDYTGDGTCEPNRPRSIPVGEECVTEDMDAPLCVEGASCDDNPRTPWLALEICYSSPRVVGDPCRVNGQGPQVCAEGLLCEPEARSSISGTCVDPADIVSVLLGEGAACQQTTECEEDLICSVFSKTCTPPTLSLGDPCPCTASETLVTDSCYDDDMPICKGEGAQLHYCSSDNVCVASDGQPGDECEVLSEVIGWASREVVFPPNTCAPGLMCDSDFEGGEGFCSNVPALEGQGCYFGSVVDLECAEGLSCNSGTCERLPSEGDTCGCDFDDNTCNDRDSRTRCWERGTFCTGGVCVRQSIQTGEAGDSCRDIWTSANGTVATCRRGLFCNDSRECEEPAASPGDAPTPEAPSPGDAPKPEAPNSDYPSQPLSLGPEGELQGDPHMIGFNGLRFDFDGRPGQAFDLVSTPDFRIHALIMPELVHGMTYVGAVGVTSSCGHTAVIRADAAEDRLTLELDDMAVEAAVGGRPLRAGSLQLEAAGAGDVRVTVAGFSMVMEVHKRVFLNVKKMAFTHGIPLGVTGVLGHTARPDRAQAQGLEHAEEHYYVDSLLGKMSAHTVQPRRMGSATVPLAAPSGRVAASMTH